MFNMSLTSFLPNVYALIKWHLIVLFNVTQVIQLQNTD